MDVLSIISTKGGVGKTTIAANLGGYLAEAGLRVLLLDLDSQPTLSSYYAIKQRAALGAFELIAENTQSLDQLVSTTDVSGLSLIHSNDDEGRLAILLLHAPDGRLRLRNLIPSFADAFDVLLIDTQGARSVVLEMAVLASDLAVAPVTPQMLAARELRRGTLKLLAELEPYQRLGVQPPPLRLLFNQVSTETVDARVIMHSLRQAFANNSGVSLLNTIIPDRVAYRNAATLGVPVHRLPHNTILKSLAPAETMQSLALELLPEWAWRFGKISPVA
ncbi:ParA family protein [Pseudomonas sp. LRF_L74]|uniref:ParA family protein n=1 Tax=Pseudomonas sp. LRF_L74 TaxID=3369422 RepID=UPI003F5EB427